MHDEIAEFNELSRRASAEIEKLEPIVNQYYKEYDLGVDEHGAFLASLTEGSSRFLKDVVHTIQKSHHRRVVCFGPNDLTNYRPFREFHTGWWDYESSQAANVYAELARACCCDGGAMWTNETWMSTTVAKYLSSNPRHLLMYGVPCDAEEVCEHFITFSPKILDAENIFAVRTPPVNAGHIYHNCRGAYDVFIAIMSRVPSHVDNVQEWCDSCVLSEDDYNEIIENMRGCISLIWDREAYAICWLDESWRVPKGEQGTSTEAHA